MTPSEIGAVFAGKAKQRLDRYELALYTAWHTAVFSSQMKHGKIDPWETIQGRFRGTPDGPVVKKDWRARKAERQAQMQQLKKHQHQRTRRLVPNTVR